MNIGSRIKQWRSDKNLKQAEAISLLGMSLSTFQKYETGISLPGAEAIEAFMRVGINANWLLTGKGEMLLADMQAPQHQGHASIPSLGELDTQRLQLAIETIEEVLEESGRKITAAKKAEAIKLAYEIFEDEDKEKDVQSFEHAQKILSKIIKSIA
jgi:transcriptional regulator with XRE-family HTH domain